ncbi:DDE-type integrase/transposase/recombinase [Actinomadura sp. NEAU-AAG5]|uniref:DDE-type integrase/transposase/recombinase n=1 Tax=Actinomadura litoris TaxID=2678616 RepID=A0A7K1L7S4_9ACTN|nr:DDE-type integrase/transposase/recombinase [Actinomadura litoris]
MGQSLWFGLAPTVRWLTTSCSTGPVRAPPEDLEGHEIVDDFFRDPARIAAELDRRHGAVLATATVHRILVRCGLNRLRDIDPPTGEALREVVRYEHDRPGELIHADVKKFGRIPAGGWRVHGVGSREALASKRVGPGTGRVGCTYLHSAVDDHSRLAYTETLDDERGTTAAAFWRSAVAFFAKYDVTAIERVSPTTAPAIDPPSVPTRSQPPTPATSGPGPTHRAPTARANATTAHSPANGLTSPLRLRGRTMRGARRLPHPNQTQPPSNHPKPPPQPPPPPHRTPPRAAQTRPAADEPHHS